MTLKALASVLASLLTLSQPPFPYFNALTACGGGTCLHCKQTQAGPHTGYRTTRAAQKDLVPK